MISLVSYPRSGNTFLRNVLHKVYGLESKTFHDETHGPDVGWEQSAVVKTHLLPHQLPAELINRPIVYLIRDGRDATVSLAHHRSDVMAAGSLFGENLTEAIYAADGSHFSGWSNHTKTWVKQADIVIRFEDLIRDPIIQVERLRPFLNLPVPDLNKLPTFEQLKAGDATYGTGKDIGKNLSKHWFRKGEVNGWKTEMSAEHQRLFWHLHGETMAVFGYRLDGSQGFDLPHLSNSFLHKCGLLEAENKSTLKLLVEANKLIEPQFDGIKRYVHQLLKVMQVFPVSNIEVDVSINHVSLALSDALKQEGSGYEAIESGVLFAVKEVLKSLLPSKHYNELAKQFPMAKVQGFLKGKTSNVAKEQETVYDLAILTLPQNFEFLKTASLKRLIAVVHDFTHLHYPQFHEQNNVDRTEQGMKYCSERNADFIAVSASTQNDLRVLGHFSEVVHEGVDRSVFYPIHNQHLLALVRERYLLPKQKFLLSVSTLEPRKNLARLVAAYAQLPRQVRAEYHLVLAGKKGWKWNDLNISEECQHQIHFTGFVREDHLPALYTLAHGFCYISLFEGFGLPVVEAMACRCPVLVSNVSSLPELVGETGVQCDPKSLQEIELGLMKLIEIGSEESSRIAAQERSWQFTWSRCWEGILRMIER